MYLKLTKEDCLLLLKKKADELGRLPQKSDFSEYEVAMIKAYLGAWPRALEAAGVKEITENYLQKMEHRKKRRIRSKKRARSRKILQQAKKTDTEPG